MEKEKEIEEKIQNEEVIKETKKEIEKKVDEIEKKKEEIEDIQVEKIELGKMGAPSYDLKKYDKNIEELFLQIKLLQADILELKDKWDEITRDYENPPDIFTDFLKWG